jgi:hypothetical protein
VPKARVNRKLGVGSSSSKDRAKCTIRGQELSKRELALYGQRLALDAYHSRGISLEELSHPGLAREIKTFATRNPARYASVVLALEEGQTVAQAGRSLRIDPNWVRFIRSMHPELAGKARRELVSNLEEAAWNLSKRLVDQGADIAIDRVPQALATVVEKLSLLTGGVTARIEHLEAPKPEDLKKMFEALPKVEALPLPSSTTPD